MNITSRNYHLGKLLAFALATIVIAFAAYFLMPKADATVSYPDPIAECAATSPQGFHISFLAYQWVLVSEDATTATFKLQLDVNPSNAENWKDVGVTRTVDKVCLSPTPTIDPCLQIVSKDAIQVDPCVTPTVTPEVTPTEAPHEHVSDGMTDPNSCTVKDCNTHRDDKVVNQSGVPLMPPSKSSK